MYCSQCGHHNRDAARFCGRCGASLIEPDPGEATVSFTPVADEDAAESPALAAVKDESALVIRTGAGRQGERFPLVGDRVSIGRAPQSDVFLDDVTVSREHALIERQPEGVVISDQGSLNGTYVNRERIERTRLADGDELQIGKYRLTYIENG